MALNSISRALVWRLYMVFEVWKQLYCWQKRRNFSQEATSEYNFLLFPDIDSLQFQSFSIKHLFSEKLEYLHIKERWCGWYLSFQTMSFMQKSDEWISKITFTYSQQKDTKGFKTAFISRSSIILTSIPVLSTFAIFSNYKG